MTRTLAEIETRSKTARETANVVKKESALHWRPCSPTKNKYRYNWSVLINEEQLPSSENYAARCSTRKEANQKEKEQRVGKTKYPI